MRTSGNFRHPALRDVISLVQNASSNFTADGMHKRRCFDIPPSGMSSCRPRTHPEFLLIPCSAFPQTLLQWQEDQANLTVLVMAQYCTRPWVRLAAVGRRCTCLTGHRAFRPDSPRRLAVSCDCTDQHTAIFIGLQLVERSDACTGGKVHV